MTVRTFSCILPSGRETNLSAIRKGPATRARALRVPSLFLMVVLAFQVCPPIAAQISAEAPRKIKVAVKPDYSDLARRLNLSGTVRVEVLIAPDGKVKKAYLLADAKHASLKLKQTGDKLSVTLPAKAPDTIDSVLVLETAN